MTNLGLFFDRMREEIRLKKQQFENLGKPHRFPCPYCSKEVVVEYHTNGTSYKLLHKVPGCPTYDKPTSRTKGDLIHAFVFHCRPALRYGAIDNLDSLDKEFHK